MTEETKTDDEQTGDPNQDGAAGETVATQIDAAVEAEFRTLDDLPEPARKIAEEYARSQSSKAVNEYRTQKAEEGIPMTKEAVQELVKKERDLSDAKAQARENLHFTLAKEHNILPHTDEYQKFATALKQFRADAIRTPEGIEMVVRAAGLSKPPQAEQDMGRAAQSYHTPRASDGTALPAHVPHGGIAIGDLNKS